MPVTAATASGISLMNAFLAGVLGPNRATGSPDSFRVRLWIDNPAGDTPSEADWPGYTPPVWSSDDWLAPDGGEVLSDGLVDFGAPSGAGTDAARFWALHDVTTDELVYSAPLRDRIAIAAASATPVKARLTVPYGRN